MIKEMIILAITGWLRYDIKINKVSLVNKLIKSIEFNPQVSLAHKWHTLGFEEAEEPDRPEFTLANPTLKLNPVNQKYEPYMSSSKKVEKIMGTLSVVVFFIVLVIVGVFGVVVFRVSNRYKP